MIGTTHFVDAFIEGTELVPTAALRLGLPATASLPPMVDWPTRLVKAVHGGRTWRTGRTSTTDGSSTTSTSTSCGGTPRHGRQRDQGRRDLLRVLSVSNEFEVEAAKILAEELGPDVPISLSSEIGRIGLLGRENATIANAALSDLAVLVVSGLTSSLEQHGVTAPLYLESERWHAHGQ